MNLGDRVIASVASHPAIRSIRLVGSRADGSATECSDWDFRVEANDFTAAAVASNLEAIDAHFWDWMLWLTTAAPGEEPGAGFR